jgi:D-alanyl-D-alanine endopeptidase (penicillin-binding protein 7)
MKSSKNALKLLLIVCVFSGAAWAKKAPAPQILATSYAVMDLETGEMLKEHNSTEVRSIASITKMMTAIITLDAHLDMDEIIHIEKVPGISTHMRIGQTISRSDLLHIALMSSDNLAAKTLAMTYPGGESTFIQRMNNKAYSLGMSHTYFTDPTGLEETNVSTAQDLIKLLITAGTYEYIRIFSTSESAEIPVPIKKKVQMVRFGTTNTLVKKYKDIIVSKTGWIHKAGGCLIMLVEDPFSKRAIVVLNSRNTHTRLVDGDLLHGIYNNDKSIRRSNN